MTSSLPTSAPATEGALGALVGCQSVSFSVSVSVGWWCQLVRSRLGSGVRSKVAIPPDPRSKPPHQGPVDKHPSRSLSPSPHHPCRPACSPGFYSQLFVRPAQPVAFGTGLGVPVTRQAFPHIIKRLCFAAFLGCWGSAGYTSFTPSWAPPLPNLLASPSRATAAWATTPHPLLG